MESIDDWDDGIPSYGSFRSRILASKIDVFVSGFLFVLFFMGIMIMIPIDLGFLFRFYFFPLYALIVTFQFFYFVVFETAFGGTVGKSFAGIVVIDSEGEKPSLRTSFVRNLERLFWLVPVLGQIVFFISVKCIEYDNQRWGDQMADTFVVYKPMKIR